MEGDQVLANTLKQTMEHLAEARRLATSPETRELVNRSERSTMRSFGMVELIDVEGHSQLNSTLTGGDFLNLDPHYVKSPPTEIPKTIMEHALAGIKQEESNGGLQTPVIRHTDPKKPINRWWKGAENVEDAGTSRSSFEVLISNSGIQDPPLKKRKRKKPYISEEFINVSLASATSSPHGDENPKVGTNLFRAFFVKENRTSAFIAEVSKLDPEVGGVIFSDDKEAKAKKLRTEFAAKVKRNLEASSNSDGDDSFTTDFLTLFTSNPEAFFHTLHLCRELKRAGITDPKEIANRIIYNEELGRAVIIDLGEHDEPELAEGNYRDMLESFDSRVPAQRLTSSLLAGIRPHAGGTNASHGPSRASTPLRDGQEGAALAGVNLSNISSPDEDNGVPDALRNSNGTNIMPLADKSANDSISEAEYLAKCKLADAYMAKITGFPYQGRLTVNQWKQMAKSGFIQPPLPHNYHPRYRDNPQFLTGSFMQEILPGVFRPCSSNWDERKAKAEYEAEIGLPPATLIDLNNWVRIKHPPHDISFDPSKHCIETLGYEMSFFREVEAYELSRIGASINPTCIHTPRNHITAKQFINLHHDTLAPLQPYMADPCLTTLGPSFAARQRYHGYSIPVPQHGGDLVTHDALFDYNATSYKVVNNFTKISRCAVCGGLQILPDHVVYLCYFWPEGLSPAMVTPEMRNFWRHQMIACCYIHVVTEGKKIPNRSWML